MSRESGQMSVEFMLAIPIFLAMLFLLVKLSMTFVAGGYSVVGKFGVERRVENFTNAKDIKCGDNGLLRSIDGMCVK